MKNLFIAAILMLFAINTFAQNTDLQNLTLAQAIQIGIKNRYDIQANKINADLANNSLAKAKHEWIPDVNATGDIRYNTQLQKLVFPGGFGGSGSDEITIGTKNSTVFALDLTQPVYKPTLKTDIKIAKNEALLEQEKNREKEISIKQTITEVYLNVILKKLLWNFAEETVKRNLEYYTVAEDKYRLKVLLENDLLKAKLDQENAKITALETRQNYDLAMTKLKYQLNIPYENSLVLTDSLETFVSAKSEFNSSAERTELKQLFLQLQDNQFRLQKSKQYFLPTLSFVANYTAQFQAENYNYFQNSWSPFNYIGLKVSMPITGGLRNKYNTNEYRLKIAQNDWQLKQKQKDIENEIFQSKMELSNAENAIIASKKNLTLAKIVYETQLNIYKLGTVTYNSVLDAETSLNTTEQNYINGVYNFLIAKVTYQRAVGKL